METLGHLHFRVHQQVIAEKLERVHLLQGSFEQPSPRCCHAWFGMKSSAMHKDFRITSTIFAHTVASGAKRRCLYRHPQPIMLSTAPNRLPLLRAALEALET